ncbi:MAG: glutathione S-transferase family protein [Proteobacteria bacterium]|nr:glutathione S-transferase family protein [Pseudomonadota bacterium]
MSRLTLVIGNKNYSSWSLRAWLALKHTGAAFDEVRIPLFTPTARAQILRHSPAGKVPVLHDGDVSVWDSLAICEHLAERFPAARLWPDERAARARARAVGAEMHAGFATLRDAMPMNCRAHLPGKGRTPGVQDDIDRITALWRDCRERHGTGGDMLFGGFTIADAMFAPVAARFVTYEVDLDPTSRAYVDAVWSLPAIEEWVAAARAETERIEHEEI